MRMTPSNFWGKQRENRINELPRCSISPPNKNTYNSKHSFWGSCEKSRESCTQKKMWVQGGFAPGSLLERLLACYLIDSHGNLQYEGKTFYKCLKSYVGKLKSCSNALQNICNMFSIWWLWIPNKAYAHYKNNRDNYFSVIVIGNSDYLMKQWIPFPFLPFFVAKNVIQLFKMP